MTGGRVVGQMARETRIPPGQIEVVGPQPLPGEAPGAEGVPTQARPYGIEIAQQLELPIVGVVTRAPTVAEARALAAAAPVAISDVVETIQTRQDTPLEKRVEFRPLGAAEAESVNDSLGGKAALALFVVLLRPFSSRFRPRPPLRAAWREADAEQGPAPPAPGPPTLLLHTDVGEPEPEDAPAGAA